jgi:NADPH:quinone reductase
MKAIQVAKYGGPEELQLQEVAQPKPGAGEALVRVHAAGVNYADIYFRNGTLPRPIPFPFTLGIEGAGEIEAVGEGVSELKRGDRVAYKWSLGSYTEYDVVKAAEIAPLPDEVRHPPQSGWLDELGRLKGGRAMGLGVARCAP